ncbi:DUF4129 domain-containing protein [Nocardia huaxiensis]|uniref:DUF4129 domain-containing protein n=1 Tax=Nocardia huaxiensis TaxID=2755382 RepID=A0A7D6VBD5_9NOCA|nr:DUF4129 domain-containing protein [Nocardia huaxiensis]QLY31091.1 DUF4129 domain-containing protein [Nocardia huaxiensis]UFS94617.1 DUF4129 domain-containing protein [Nocardia huaxiensis]
MTQPPVPPTPDLGPAADHRAASEYAAQRQDFATALRERYRAVTRGLEQHGVLEEQRGRTARETAQAAATALGGQEQGAAAAELPSAAHSFDEIVYGGRHATEGEYRRLEQADRFSVAPAPKRAPAEIAEKRRRTRTPKKAREKRTRERMEWPPFLSDWRFWAGAGAILGAFLLIYILTHIGTPPDVTPPDTTDLPDAPDAPERPDLDEPDYGEGSDSIFRKGSWAAFGGLQLLIAWGVVLVWRGRRRGAVVGEARPVEAPANELLAGQAGLYRKSRDHDHVAAKLRAAALRRLRPALNVTADTSPDMVTMAVATRTGAAPALVHAALYEPVTDQATLETVAAQLEWIESEVL